MTAAPTLAPAASAAVDERPPSGSVDAPARSSRRSRHGLSFHVGLLVLVLAATAVATKPTVATLDEGSYGSQADALQAGSWVYPWNFADIDPAGRWFPIINGSGSGSEWYPYVKHPLLPRVQAALGDLVGRDVGYVLPSVLGVLGAAAAASAVARRCRAGTEGWAFWLVAAGPLLFNATVIWAHAPGAAFAGLATLGAVAVSRDRRITAFGAQAAMSAGLAGAVLVRSEALLFGLALLGALVLDRLLTRRDGEEASPTVRLAGAAMVAVPGLATLGGARLLERAWIAGIAGTAPSDLGVRSLDPEISWVEGRFQGLWASTLSGSDLAERSWVLPVLLVAVLVAVLLRRRLSPGALAVVLGCYALVLLLLLASAPAQLIGGLLPAWPLVVVGVAAAGARLWTHHRLLLLTSGVYALATWATEYPDGGTFQWGGRFFMVAAVPLAVMAADGLHGLVGEARSPATSSIRHDRRLGVLAMTLVALAVVSTLAPLVGLRAVRSSAEPIYESISRASGPVAISVGRELPRLMWRSDIEWLHVPANELDEALGALRGTGLQEVSVVTAGPLTAADVSAFGRIRSRAEIAGSELAVVRIRRR